MLPLAESAHEAAISDSSEERLSRSIRQSVQSVIPAAAPMGPAIGTV